MLIGLAAIAAWLGSMHYRYAYRFHWHGVVYAIASVGGRIVIDNEPQRIDFARAHPQLPDVISEDKSTTANGISIHSMTITVTRPPPLPPLVFPVRL